MGDASVRPRDERHKVMIKARMRIGASWHDVCILNLSTRGVGIQAGDPPPRGSYVEIRRGAHVVIARIVWTRGHRAGLRSQDAIFVQALMNEPAAAPRPPVAEGRPIERRRAPRTTQQRHEQSRIAARAFEFVGFALVAGALGFTAFGAVGDALAQPLSTIEAALSPGDG